MEMTRGEMQDLLMKFSLESPKYRDALIADPRNIVEKQFAIEVPEHITVKAVQETADTIYVVVPHAVEQGAELSDADLEAVAGGHSIVKEAKCGGGDGNLNTVVNLEASLGL